MIEVESALNSSISDKELNYVSPFSSGAEETTAVGSVSLQDELPVSIGLFPLLNLLIVKIKKLPRHGNLELLLGSNLRLWRSLMLCMT